MKPTLAECDELAIQIRDFLRRHGNEAIGIVGDIVQSVGHHEIERDGLTLPDSCHTERVQKAINATYGEE